MVQGKKLPPQTPGTQGPAVETGQRGDRRDSAVGLLLFSQRSRGYSGQLRVGRGRRRGQC